MNKLRKLNTLLLFVLVMVLATMLFVACDKTPETPEKKDITGVTFSDSTVTYDGQEHALTVSGTIPEGVTVSYTNNKGTDTGVYNATATLSGEGYNTLTLSAKLTIVGQDITGITLVDATVPYDKQAHQLTITGNLPEGVTVAYTYNGQAANSATEYGTHTVVATLSGKGYNTLTLTATLTIEAKDITGVTFKNRTVTYNGNEYILELEGSLPAGVTSTITGNDAGTDAGTYTATVELWGIGYKPLKLTATLTINPAEITGITLTGDTVEYNGQPHSIVINGTLPNGATVTYTYNGQSANSATEVGTYTVVATISGKNYITKTLSAELKIVNKLIKGVTFVDDTVTYDGNEHELTITTTAEFPQNITVSYQNNKGTNAGTYNASVTLSGVGYEPQTLYATLTIEKATITGITFNNDSVEYDALAHSIQIVGNVPAGVTTTYYYDGEEATSVTTVGKHEVKAVLSGPNHYTLELTAYLTITAKEEMLYVAYFNGYIYFQNNLDGNRLYRVSRNGTSLEKVSNDVANYFTANSTNLFYYSATLLNQSIKTINKSNELNIAFNPGRATYITSDNDGYIYYSKANLIDRQNENGIYKVKVLNSNGSIIEDSTAVRLTTDKADYLAYYNGFIYYSNSSDGGKLYRISVNANEQNGEKLTDEKVSDIIVDGGMVYFSQHTRTNSTIQSYNISSKVQKQLTIDNGAYLTKINDYIYYVNKDLLTSIFGKGIYRVSVFGGEREQVLEDDGNGYYSLSTDETYLYYFKLNDKHLYRYNLSTTAEADLMRSFEPVESSTLSAYPYASFATYKDEIYYTNPLDGNSLYKYNPQTKAIYKVLSNSVSNVFFHNDYMYYSTYVVTNYALWKLDMTDAEAMPIKISSHRYENLIFVGDDIYAIRVTASVGGNCIVKLSPSEESGTEKYTETEVYNNRNVHISKLFLLNGKFHFTISPTGVNALRYKKYIYTHDFDSSDTKQEIIIEVYSNNFAINNGKYYYYNHEKNTFCSTDMTTASETVIAQNVEITDICEYDGTIYYTSVSSQNKGIYAYNISAKTNTKLTDKVGHGLTVVNGQLFFTNIALNYPLDYPSPVEGASGDGHMYSINLSTNVVTKIA